jgi:hypothetical protein
LFVLKMIADEKYVYEAEGYEAQLYEKHIY